MRRFFISDFPLVIFAVCLSGGCAALGLSSAGSVASAEGPTAVSSVISNPSVFDYTTGSTKVPYMSPASLLNDNTQLDAFIIHEQCYFGTPDPLFFVPQQATDGKWTFAGRLDSTRQFQALEYRSVLTLGLRDGGAQLNTWPVNLVSLSDMPQVYLDRRLPLPAQAKLSSGDQEELVQTYLRDANQIRRVVSRFEESYDPEADCVARKSSL